MENLKKLSLLFLTILGIMRPLVIKSQIRIDDSPSIKVDTNLYAIAITKNNISIYQHYFNQKSAADLFNDQSLTKSIMSLLIGISIDKGYISSLDEKIVEYFPGLGQDTDNRKQRISIRQIMNQSSGLYHEDLNKLVDYLALSDPSSFTLQQPLLTDPDSSFHYSNAASHLLSVIITKSTGMPTLDFAKKYLFGPLQIEKVEWMKMNDGYYDGSGLLSVRLSVMDMNKIGMLVLDTGIYKGQRIVSVGYIQQVLNPEKTFQTGWGFPGSVYGLCWYHKNYRGIAITYGVGWGGQYNFIIPALHAVVTVNERVDDAVAIPQNERFLSQIFPLIFDELEKN